MKRTNANEIFSKVDAYLLGIIRDKAADYENPATTPGELYQFALDTANLRLFALKCHLVSRWHAYCLLRRHAQNAAAGQAGVYARTVRRSCTS